MAEYSPEYSATYAKSTDVAATWMTRGCHVSYSFSSLLPFSPSPFLPHRRPFSILPSPLPTTARPLFPTIFFLSLSEHRYINAISHPEKAIHISPASSQINKTQRRSRRGKSKERETGVEEKAATVKNNNAESVAETAVVQLEESKNVDKDGDDAGEKTLVDQDGLDGGVNAETPMVEGGQKQEVIEQGLEDQENAVQVVDVENKGEVQQNEDAVEADAKSEYESPRLVSGKDGFFHEIEAETVKLEKVAGDSKKTLVEKNKKEAENGLSLKGFVAERERKKMVGKRERAVAGSGEGRRENGRRWGRRGEGKEGGEGRADMASTCHPRGCHVSQFSSMAEYSGKYSAMSAVRDLSGTHTKH